MKYYFLTLCLFLTLTIAAQVPEDALRTSWFAPSGTARQQAIGGAMGSLGGEISATYVNPAGLGFYRTGEIVLSPGYRFQKDNSIYRGTSSSGSTVGNFNLGTSGVVFAIPSQNPEGSGAISITVNRTANFGGNTYYKGQNDYSSFSEQYVEEFAKSGLSIDQALGNSGLSYGTRMALYTYLIDTATIGGTLQVIGQPQKILDAHGLLLQENNIRTKGGITEIALGLGGSGRGKWYYGGSIGVPILDYTRNQTFTESDLTGNTNNDFNYSTYTETYTSKGVGVNFKLGVIFKPDNAWRVGLAIHSPSFYALTDNISAAMTTNTDKYAAPSSISSAELDSQTGSVGSVKYDLQSAWKVLLSGSYIFGGGPENTKGQKGFITGDVEWVVNRDSKFSSPQDNNGNPLYDNGYFDAVNNAIKSYYRNNFNVRLGGELKFDLLAARLGFAYSTSPYKQSGLQANRLTIAGGVGYRNKGVFVDLTYVQNITNDVNFPYRLADKENTYATVKQFAGTVLLTVGFKF
ncbi:MAG: hypothetical protein C5B59_05240 [Bacteroidetes bacterium]|nr:MAG: hypothetical protein C5B59_05240 [Bacteroidota bacterium]